MVVGANSGVSASARSGRAELIGLILAISVPAGLIGLWASPRPARPTEMPPLVFRTAEVQETIAGEVAIESRLASDDPDEIHRRALYLATGLAEVRRDDRPEAASARVLQLTQLAHRIAERGPELLASARARDVGRLMPVLLDEGHRFTETERASELGAFPQMLERYGAVAGGRRIAPEIVLRTMFFARWSSIHGLEMTDGMTPLELRAYYGWLALEGGVAPLGMRADAVEAYASVGGTRVWEARGVLAFESGELATARSDFEHAYELTGSVRLRNHALAAMQAELQDDASLE